MLEFKEMTALFTQQECCTIKFTWAILYFYSSADLALILLKLAKYRLGQTTLGKVRDMSSIWSKVVDRCFARVKGKLVLPLVLPPPDGSRAAGNRGQILLSHARIKLPSPSQHEEDGSSAWRNNRWKKEQRNKTLWWTIAARNRLNYGA